MICLLCRNIRGVIYSLPEEGPAHISEYGNHHDHDLEGDDSNGIGDNLLLPFVIMEIPCQYCQYCPYWVVMICLSDVENVKKKLLMATIC